MNMSRWWVTCLVLLSFNATAQLLRNDFEDYTSLPTQLGEWFKLNGVENASSGDQNPATPDFLHLSAVDEADLPETAFAWISPYSGSGVMGIHIADKYDQPQYEYLTLQLNEPVQQGKSYHLKFYWSNGKLTPISKGGLAVANLGVLFSSNIPTQIASEPINQEPQCKFEGIMYSEIWREANITFNAPENASFLTIGLFGPADLKNIITPIFPHAEVAYYYFDKIEMWEVNQDHVIRVPWIDDGMPDQNNAVVLGSDIVYVPNSFTPNEDGKNDVFLKMEKEILGWQLEVYNKWGQLVHQNEQATMGWDGKSTMGNVEGDIYYWKLNYRNTEGLLQSSSGSVFLIR